VLGAFEDSPAADEGTRNFFETDAAESPSTADGLLTLINWDSAAAVSMTSGRWAHVEGLASEADLAVELVVGGGFPALYWLLGASDDSPVAAEGTRDFLETAAAKSPSRAEGLLTLINWESGAAGPESCGMWADVKGLASGAGLAVELVLGCGFPTLDWLLGTLEDSLVAAEGTRDFLETAAAESPARAEGLLTLINWDAGANASSAARGCPKVEGLTSGTDFAVEVVVDGGFSALYWVLGSSEDSPVAGEGNRVFATAAAESLSRADGLLTLINWNSGTDAPVASTDEGPVSGADLADVVVGCGFPAFGWVLGSLEDAPVADEGTRDFFAIAAAESPSRAEGLLTLANSAT